MKGVFCSHKSQCQSIQSTPKEQAMYTETTLQTTSKEGVKEDG